MLLLENCSQISSKRALNERRGDFLSVFQEHHLQRAISAQQVFREKKETMVIPVPEAESNTTYYDRLYRGEVRVPKQLIHIQREYSSTCCRSWTRT